jgi:hypothetical protein
MPVDAAESLGGSELVKHLGGLAELVFSLSSFFPFRGARAEDRGERALRQTRVFGERVSLEEKAHVCGHRAGHR